MTRSRVLVALLALAMLCGVSCGGGEVTTDAGDDATYGHTPDDGQASLDGGGDALIDANDSTVTFPYDAATYDASWYDGGLAEPCPIANTPCAQPSYIIYGCACFNERCFDGAWQMIEGGPCH